MQCVVACVVAACVMVGGRVQADDWPQWMGPRRDNVWREEGVLETFPAEGPRVLWRVPAPPCRPAACSSPTT